MRTPCSSVAEVIERHRALRHPEDVRCLGHGFRVWPGVFSPLIAPSGYTELAFAAWPIFEGRTVLDIGSGSGISTCLFALGGARHVVGVDINPAAVAAGEENARSARVSHQVSFRLGDVFAPIDASERFDIVFANLPLMSGEPADLLERAFYDPGLSATRRFLHGAAERLHADSSVRAFLCAADFEPHNLAAFAGGLGLRWETAMSIRLQWVELQLVGLVPYREAAGGERTAASRPNIGIGPG